MSTETLVIILIIAIILLIVIIVLAVIHLTYVKKNDGYIIINTYNSDGGFFWHVYNMISAAHIAEKSGRKLIVHFGSGPYLETNPLYQKLYGVSGPNWFHYYFEPHHESRLSEKEIEGLWKQGKEFVDDQDAHVVIYGSKSFRERNPEINYNHLWNKYVKPLPHVNIIVDEFYSKHMMGRYVIGIHVRLTDKYGTPDDDEDGPIHYEYEFCTKMIKKCLREVPKGEIPVVFVCSDESACVKYIEKHITTAPVVYTDSIRSEYNSGGAHLNTSTCNDDTSLHPDCVKLREMRSHSIHLGHQHLSSYKKGLEALVDVLLLAKSNVFLRSRGNFSNFPPYINPSMKVIDMVDKYQR